ncbi:substrate-binding periplasmic protein [Inhella gelatinilytica]|uniref:Transporter substrate-binding domain-containing protein n=1 Tax=Inhella gelatinilytica TaxID=2795030 RepID=A0A931IT41_9BURK|nr:transporter substrate-binding domain-containing protein [Inhella gelatinilytica]MBH9551502.1 transporter substrate-binding domain-containing protein [Inhella gelatinilytica]
MRLPSAPLSRRTCLGSLSLLGWAPLTASAAEDTVLYSYHLKPPYLDLTRKEGLYYELADLLSLRVPGLRCRVEYLPRRRLEADLVAGRLRGAILGVHPTWFRDAERSRYLWTPPVMRDADVVVSRHDHPVAYTGPDSLVGVRMALPRGYYYAGIEELVQAGRIPREESESDETALMMLSLGRADATVITRRTLYTLLARRPGLRGRFHVAPKPHDEYERHILVPHDQPALHKQLSEGVALLARDPAWQGRLQEQSLR